MLLYFAVYLVFLLVALIFQFEDYQFYIFSAASVLIVFNLPAIIIHWSYYQRNKDIALKIYSNRLEMIKDDQIIFSFRPEEVTACDAYLSATMNRYNMGNGLPNEAYKHVVLSTATDKFSVTNMLYPDPVYLVRYYNIKVTIHERLFTI